MAGRSASRCCRLRPCLRWNSRCRSGLRSSRSSFWAKRLTPSRIGVIILGFIGTLVILRPGFTAFQPALLIPLVCAVGYAIFNALTKKLTATEPTYGILFWMNVIQLPISYLASDKLFFLKLDWSQLPSVIGLSVAGLSAHYCLTNAFRAGDATLVMPIDFLRVPLIAFVGWWFLGKSRSVRLYRRRDYALRHHMEPPGGGKKGTQARRGSASHCHALTPRRRCFSPGHWGRELTLR